MRYIAVIRENPNTYEWYATFHQGMMPAFMSNGPYETADAARAANPDYNWREPNEDDEADGDVAYIAYYQG